MYLQYFLPKELNELPSYKNPHTFRSPLKIEKVAETRDKSRVILIE